jgi:hypothetical protein
VGAAALVAKFFDEKMQQHVLDFQFEWRGGVAIEVGVRSRVIIFPRRSYALFEARSILREVFG